MRYNSDTGMFESDDDTLVFGMKKKHCKPVTFFPLLEEDKKPDFGWQSLGAFNANNARMTMWNARMGDPIARMQLRDPFFPMGPLPPLFPRPPILR